MEGVEISADKMYRQFTFKYGKYCDGKIKAAYRNKTKYLSNEKFKEMFIFNDSQWNEYFNSNITTKYHEYLIQRTWEK